MGTAHHAPAHAGRTSRTVPPQLFTNNPRLSASPLLWEPKKREPRPERIARILTSDERLYQREFWEFFSVEGMGDTRRFAEIGSAVRGMNARKRSEACSRVEHDFMAAFDILCHQVPGFRDRLLDATLTGMLSDFSARNITWYVNIHRHLNPDSRELSRREGVMRRF